MTKKIIWKCMIDPECGKEFVYMQTWKDHEAYAHRTEKDFACTKNNDDGTPCTQAYRGPKDLQRHVTLKHTEAEYRCTTCPKVYATPRGLSEHGPLCGRDDPTPFK
jgi:hypothetical protein